MKKIALIAAVALALPVAALAQSAADAAKPPLKERAANTAKKVTQKVVPKRVIKKIEEAKPISEESDVVLTPEDMAVSQRVLTGTIKCELGASVAIEASQKKPGFFVLTHGSTKYFMHPVNSRTGAIRLEDPKAEAMWLQLGNKSMLMSQKQGLRLADECQATEQATMAEDMKKNPPKSLFDGADAPKK
jgi:Ni/Co efflux regulator RcnB